MKHDPYIHALGLVTRHFQELELCLSILAWGLMGKDQRVGQTITATLSFSKLLVLTSTLIKTKTKKKAILDCFKAIARQATLGEQGRNRVIHSAYLQTSNDPNAEMIRYKVTSKLEKGLVVHWEALPYEEIMDIAVELRQTYELTAHFIKQYRLDLQIDFSGFSASIDDSDDDIPF